MKHLVLYVSRNSEGKRDGDEFAREANAYAEYHLDVYGAEIVMIPVPCLVPALRRPAAVENSIRQALKKGDDPFDVFAYFGHGTERWIQTGHTLAKLDGFVMALASVLTRTPILWWAACKTAANNPRPPRGGEVTRGGILQHTVMRLLSGVPPAEQISATGWGHLTAGHTTRNPNLALVTPWDRFEVSRVDMKMLQKKLWIPDGTLRFEIPLCTSIDSLIERAKS